MSGRRRSRPALVLVVPFLLWGVGFVTLYAAHSFACAHRWADGVRPALALTLAFLLAAHAWLSWSYWQQLRKAEDPPVQFLHLTGFGLSLAALGSSVWTGSPVLFLSICS